MFIEEEMLAIALKESMATIIEELTAREESDSLEDLSGCFTYVCYPFFLYTMHFSMPDILVTVPFFSFSFF